MVQEIKIDDNLTIQFEDMTAKEYVELTLMDKPDREDFANNNQYNNAKIKQNFDYLDAIANKIFKVNGEKYDTNKIKPYQVKSIYSLINGYVLDVNAKKVWDLKGGETKQEEKIEKENILKASQNKKEKQN